MSSPKMQTTKNKVPCILCATVVLLCLASGCLADTITWKATQTGGKWSAATNWDLRVPNATDDVVIHGVGKRHFTINMVATNDFNITIDVPIIVNSITVTDGGANKLVLIQQLFSLQGLLIYTPNNVKRTHLTYSHCMQP
jgi:hypothetical protein